MKVVTRWRCRPVWPPGAISTVCPVMTTGMFTTSRNPPSEVTKLLVLTPFGWGGAAGAWASANEASPSTARLATASAKPVALMRHLLEWTARSPSFDCRSRDSRDELVEAQGVDDL